MLNILRGVLVGALTVLSVGNAMAGTPDASMSDVPNVTVSPGGTIDYVVTVRDNGGSPLSNAWVEIRMSPAANALVCWCAGQANPSVFALTGAGGEAVFALSGGGCIDPALLGGTVAEIYVDGGLLTAVGVVSPDAVDNGGLLPTSGWNPGGQCSVGLSDATFHTGPIASGAYSYCTDIDSDLAVTLTDAVILTQPISQGASCDQ